MTVDQLIAHLEQQKLKMFTTKDSLEEALEWADKFLLDVPRHDVLTVLFTYHNSLLNSLQTTLKREQTLKD